MYLGNPTFINCTMVGNQARISCGGAIYDPNGQATLKNCILWGNTSTRGVTEASQIGGGVNGIFPGALLRRARRLVRDQRAQHRSSLRHPSNGNYELLKSSPCKNAGESVLPADIGNLDWDMDYEEPIPLDLNLSNRVTQGALDLGAYEVPLDIE